MASFGFGLQFPGSEEMSCLHRATGRVPSPSVLGPQGPPGIREQNSKLTTCPSEDSKLPGCPGIGLHGRNPSSCHLCHPYVDSFCQQRTGRKLQAPTKLSSKLPAEQVSWAVGIPLPTTTNDGQEGREEKDTGLRSTFYFYHPF